MYSNPWINSNESHKALTEAEILEVANTMLRNKYRMGDQSLTRKNTFTVKPIYPCDRLLTFSNWVEYTKSTIRAIWRRYV